MPFRASAIFCFTSFTLAKHFPLRTFSSRETKRNVAQGEIGWIGRVGHGHHAVFGEELLNTQCGVGRYARKSLTMKWANALSLPKNSLRLNAASHNNANWYKDTDGLLEHSPSGRSLYYQGSTLQKIISVFWGPPRYVLSWSAVSHHQKEFAWMKNFENGFFWREGHTSFLGLLMLKLCTLLACRP